MTNLIFTDSTFYTGKCFGISSGGSSGNGLIDKSLKILEIPSKYQGSKVVELGFGSLSGSLLERVFIPKTVKFIRECAFSGCQKLVEVRFESGSELEKMEDDVFVNCNSLKNIDIPSSLKLLLNNNAGNYLFYGVSSLVCFSYLGSTDFSTAYVFSNNPEVHVSDSLYPKDKQFGQRNVIRDGKTCGVSNKRFYQILETINRRKLINLINLLISLMNTIC